MIRLRVEILYNNSGNNNNLGSQFERHNFHLILLNRKLEEGKNKNHKSKAKII